MAVDGVDGQSPEELLELGINVSGQHGLHDRRPEVEVDGLAPAAVPIMRDDAWQLRGAADPVASDTLHPPAGPVAALPGCPGCRCGVFMRTAAGVTVTQMALDRHHLMS